MESKTKTFAAMKNEETVYESHLTLDTCCSEVKFNLSTKKLKKKKIKKKK